MKTCISDINAKMLFAKYPFYSVVVNNNVTSFTLCNNKGEHYATLTEMPVYRGKKRYLLTSYLSLNTLLLN